MQRNLENFIFGTLSKLDSQTIILLIPIAILIYCIMFISPDELELIFNSDNSNTITNDTVNIVCPTCHDEFTIYIIDDELYYNNKK